MSRVRAVHSTFTRFAAVVLAMCLCAVGAVSAWGEKQPAGEGFYEDFVELFQGFAEWNQAQSADLAVPGSWPPAACRSR